MVTDHSVVKDNAVFGGPGRAGPRPGGYAVHSVVISFVTKVMVLPHGVGTIIIILGGGELISSCIFDTVGISHGPPGIEDLSTLSVEAD